MLALSHLLREVLKLAMELVVLMFVGSSFHVSVAVYRNELWPIQVLNR